MDQMWGMRKSVKEDSKLSGFEQLERADYY